MEKPRAMKLRLKDNSLRLRVSPEEVARLLAGQQVQTITRFGPEPAQCLSYSLEAWPELPAMTAVYKPGRIRVLIPAHLLDNWNQDTPPSLSETQALGAGQSLTLLVEKDLPCKENPADSPAH
jgi:hypothetical protein